MRGSQTGGSIWSVTTAGNNFAPGIFLFVKAPAILCAHSSDRDQSFQAMVITVSMGS